MAMAAAAGIGREVAAGVLVLRRREHGTWTPWAWRWPGWS